MFRLLPLALLVLVVGAGCTSTKTSNTARTAKEQLLISNAVDQSLGKVDFSPFAGRVVFIDDKFVDCVDKNYIVASVRHRVLREGCELASAPDAADVVLELRSGGVGTDSSDAFVGTPEITLPGMLTLPEVRLITRSTQHGTAKLGIVAYDPKTRRSLGEGGVSMASSDDNNWYILGVGPYQSGSVRNEAQMSNHRAVGQAHHPLPPVVAFSPAPLSTAPGTVRLTGGDDGEPAKASEQ